MFRSDVLVAALIVAASLLHVGCGDDDVGMGGEGQACHADTTCNGDHLTCVSGYCVQLPSCGAGDTQPCSCSETEEGVQVCLGDGVWDDCNCAAECGNDVVEQDEHCDGADLDGRTCETEGFGGGTLACDGACQLDVSDCDPCGNSVVDAGEECDGSDLDGATCESEGFGGGTLDCSATCQLDVTGCDLCGNGVVDAGEECDGTDHDGATCESEGYTMGSLGCAACALDTSACLQCSETNTGELLGPLMLVVLLDRSGSMSGANWDGTEAALSQFFQSQSAAGVSAGISYFPPLNSALDECDPMTYSTPEAGPVDLPTSAQTLITSMGGVTVSGITPTYGALQGSLSFAVAYKDTHPTHAVAVVLATDGDPTECNQNIPDIAALAASAHNYNGVQTYAVAIQGASIANLDQIAQAGGGQAFDVTSDITQLTQHMEEIRSLGRSCELVLPQAALADLGNTNVLYTPSGGAPARVSMADDASDCGTGPGWYLDDPAAPTSILLCPMSCAAYQADLDSVLEAWGGCPTELN